MQLANKFISELYLVASNTFSELSAHLIHISPVYLHMGQSIEEWAE